MSLKEDEQYRTLINAFFQKHYKHWGVLKTLELGLLIRDLLMFEIRTNHSTEINPQTAYGLFEALEFVDRQSKYVVAGQRAYEALGLSWRLPLWDPSLLRFWEKTPLRAKENQKLYRQVLTEANWANVWQDIPVNPTIVRPKWIIPVRLLLKAFFSLPFTGGRQGWYTAEKRYCDYWMDNLCGYATYPYVKVALDRRGHHNFMGWHIEETLLRHGLTWKGNVVPNPVPKPHLV